LIGADEPVPDATLRPDKGYACVTIVIALGMMIGVLALAILAINVFPLQQDFALKSKVELILSALALATLGALAIAFLLSSPA
jgi:hypothetical protein